MTSRSRQIKEATAIMAQEQAEAAARDSAKDQVVASKEQAIMTLTRELAAARDQCDEGRNRSHLLASHEKTMLESILDCEQQVHIVHKSLVHAEAEGKRLEMEMMQLQEQQVATEQMCQELQTQVQKVQNARDECQDCTRELEADVRNKADEIVALTAVVEERGVLVQEQVSRTGDASVQTCVGGLVLPGVGFECMLDGIGACHDLCLWLEPLCSHVMCAQADIIADKETVVQALEAKLSTAQEHAAGLSSDLDAATRRAAAEEEEMTALRNTMAGVSAQVAREKAGREREREEEMHREEQRARERERDREACREREWMLEREREGAEARWRDMVRERDRLLAAVAEGERRETEREREAERHAHVLENELEEVRLLFHHSKVCLYPCVSVPLKTVLAAGHAHQTPLLLCCLGTISV